MATKSDYTIPYEGLKEGVHKLEFTIGKEFIEQRKIENVRSLDLGVSLTVNKNKRLFTVEMVIYGSIETICDRCLEKLSLPISYSNTFYVKTGIPKDNDFEDDDDILYIEEGKHHIDLSHYIYESVILAIPLKKVHENDDNDNPTCNNEVMRLLHRNNKKNEKNKPNDPRWDALRNLNID